MIPVEQLSKLQLFHQKSVASLAKLSAAFEEVAFNVEDVILTEGAQSDALYLIASGTVRIQVKIDPAGDRFRIVARLGKEEIFGEISFFEGNPLSATVIADEAVTAYRLKRESLVELLKQDQTVALENLLTILSGVFSKLQRTTRELVTVFEVAGIMAQDKQLKESLGAVLSHMQAVLPEKVSSAFYRWNLFNNEYDLMNHIESEQAPKFKETLGLDHPFLEGTPEGLRIIDQPTGSSTPGTFSICPVNWLGYREGLFVFFCPKNGFDSGARQMMEAISAVVAPSLSTARTREEEESKRYFDERRQEGNEL